MFGRGGGTVQTTFTAKDNMSPVVRGIRNTMDQFKRDAATGFGLGAGISVFNTAQRAFGAAVDFMGDAVNVASDLTEQQSKVGAVFKDSAGEVTAWAQDLDASFGLSERAALTMAGTLGNLFTSMGIGIDQASEMSRGLAELAGDLASFNNADIKDVMVALQSGIVGETEPVRRLGIDLLDASVSAEALAMGLKESAKELTAQDKIVARYSLIMKQTANAQGDAARTADTLAGKQRQLNAQFEDMQAELGSMLIGPATDFLGFLNDVLVKISGGEDPMPDVIRDLADSFRDLTDAAGGGGDMQRTVRTLEEIRKAVEEVVFAGDINRSSAGKWVQQLGEDFLVMADRAGVTVEQLFVLASAAASAGKGFSTFRASAVAAINGVSTTAAPMIDAWTLGMGQMVTAVEPFKVTLRQTPRLVSRAVVDMKQTIKSGKAGIVEQFRLLAWQSKHPFREKNYEEWLREKQAKAIRKMERAIRENKPGVVEQTRGLVQAIQAELNTLPGRTESIVDSVIADLASIGPAVTGSMGTAMPTPPKKKKNGKRAAGGPVEAGGAYLVGERGPEMLVMGNRSGHITPNHAGGHGHDIILDGRLVGRAVDRHQGRALNFVGSSSR